MRRLDVLYRGPLSSCNFGCEYCPFAKREESGAELAADRRALERFVGWVRGERERSLGVFFTPWGEALVRGWYRRAMVELSWLPQVQKVAAQTNLSTPLSWLDAARADRIGLWATYHPEWMERARFVARIHELVERGVSVSAGMVGFRRFTPELEALRVELPPEVYLWVNAPKSREVLADEEVARLEAIDPLVRLNVRPHASRGLRCYAGETAIAVDGEGTIRRCHFVEAPIGSLYQPDWARALEPRTCPRDQCGCHIGYAHLEPLGLHQIFGPGLLERALPRDRS